MLLGQLDALVVDEAGVFDRIDPGADGILDRLGSVRMSRYFTPELVRLLGDCLHLLDRVLPRANSVSL